MVPDSLRAPANAVLNCVAGEFFSSALAALAVRLLMNSLRPVSNRFGWWIPTLKK
jgi:hypothetical protein